MVKFSGFQHLPVNSYQQLALILLLSQEEVSTLHRLEPEHW